MPDQGHIETELILRETEADVRRVYRQAVEETQKKLDDYLRRFEVKDNIKREQLARGEITSKEYADWKKGQILIGQRWEEMRNTLAQDLHNSNVIARSIVQGHMPEAYAVNHNYATFQIEKGSMVDTSYTLYDRQTVERIIRDQPDLLPPPGKNMLERIAANKDIAWQRGQIQSVAMQSILQGESIPKMAKRIAREMGEKNNKAAVRYARTTMTGAQNAGRVDAYERANKMGIETEKEWLATMDDRTRDSHVWIDGEHVGVNEMFSNGCRFPGDPYGPGYEVWNCRCTLVPRVKGVDQSNAPRNSKLGDMTYDEWKHEHDTSKGLLDQKEPSKFTFTPAKSLEEAERYISRYVDTSIFGATGVSYQGVSLDVANEINRTIGKFHETFNVGKFGGVIAPAGNTKLGKAMTGATAGWSDIRQSMLLNRKSLKTMESAEKAFAAERTAVTDVLTHPERYDLSRASAQLRRLIENSKASGRGTVPETIEEAINHELGHSLKRIVRKLPEWDRVTDNMGRYAQNISGYACQDADEYLAESFCSYMKNEGIIDPVLHAVFEGLKR